MLQSTIFATISYRGYFATLCGKIFKRVGDNMTLGKHLVELRKKHNLTQNDLAKSLSVSRGAISMWEINQRTPDLETLKNIADLFDVSIDWLLGRTNNTQQVPVTCHTTDPTLELPEEARRSLEEFKDYILKKYGKQVEYR
jgi:transcriptional regulator with XRE-family HTH domain